MNGTDCTATVSADGRNAGDGVGASTHQLACDDLSRSEQDPNVPRRSGGESNLRLDAPAARHPEGVLSYIESFDAAAGGPQTAAKAKADMAIEFIDVAKLDGRKNEELDKAMMIVRDRRVEVANHDRVKPGEAVEKIRVQYPAFSIDGHTVAWRHFEIRPRSGALDKSKTSPSTASTTARTTTTSEPTPR
ncbi:MAG: hypothetical protein M3169_06795 [Candidatus Eremiobacteraeota bacterium]|nr:hypothetical protein [Candidatus Eremiobacteraeota bacterium]